MSRRNETARRSLLALRSLLGVLLCLGLVLTLVLGAAFSLFATQTRHLVTDEYLARAEEMARTSLAGESIYFGIPEQTLSAALDVETLSETAEKSTQSLLDALLRGGEYEPASYPQDGFSAVVSAYAREQAESGAGEVQQEGIEEVSARLGALCTSAAAPMSSFLYQTALSSVAGQLPTWLLGVVRPAFFGTLGVTLLLFGVLLLLSLRRSLMPLAASLFCGSSLVFVPTAVLLSVLNLDALALGEGVTLCFVKGLFSRVFDPLLLSSAILFSLSAVFLLVAIVLSCRKTGDKPAAETPSGEVETSAETPNGGDVDSAETSDETRDEAPNSAECEG